MKKFETFFGGLLKLKTLRVRNSAIFSNLERQIETYLEKQNIEFDETILSTLSLEFDSKLKELGKLPKSKYFVTCQQFNELQKKKEFTYIAHWMFIRMKKYLQNNFPFIEKNQDKLTLQSRLLTLLEYRSSGKQWSVKETKFVCQYIFKFGF